MQIDRRQPRVILDQPVTLVPPDGSELQGRIRNLSRGGAFIVDLDQQPRVEAQVHVAFVLPHGPEVEANATVLRTVPSGHPEEPEGIAVKFDDDDPGALAAFIREALGPGGEASSKVRLKLDTHGGVVITARERTEESGVVTVECDLPFLCIGSGVHLQRAEGDEPRAGTLSWVSAQTPPGSPYPRIHLGIRLRAGREDPTPDVIPATRGKKHQDPTEMVEPTLPHPLIEGPRTRRRPRLALRWLLPTILGGLLVGGGIVVGVHYTRNLRTDPVEPRLLEAPQQEATPAPGPVEPAPEPEEPVEPPKPAPVAVPLAFATERAADEDAAARRTRRTRSARSRAAPGVDPRRVRRADPQRRGIQRLLYRAKVSLRRGKLDRARRYLLRVLSRDPSNEDAAELMRRVLRKKKKTPANT
jgi:Tfp pilus assembly protein PilZ